MAGGLQSLRAHLPLGFLRPFQFGAFQRTAVGNLHHRARKAECPVDALDFALLAVAGMAVVCHPGHHGFVIGAVLDALVQVGHFSDQPFGALLLRLRHRPAFFFRAFYQRDMLFIVLRAQCFQIVQIHVFRVDWLKCTDFVFFHFGRLECRCWLRFGGVFFFSLRHRPRLHGGRRIGGKSYWRNIQQPFHLQDGALVRFNIPIFFADGECKR